MPSPIHNFLQLQYLLYNLCGMVCGGPQTTLKNHATLLAVLGQKPWPLLQFLWECSSSAAVGLSNDDKLPYSRVFWSRKTNVEFNPDGSDFASCSTSQTKGLNHISLGKIQTLSRAAPSACHSKLASKVMHLTRSRFRMDKGSPSFTSHSAIDKGQSSAMLLGRPCRFHILIEEHDRSSWLALLIQTQRRHWRQLFARQWPCHFGHHAFHAFFHGHLPSCYHHAIRSWGF